MDKTRKNTYIIAAVALVVFLIAIYFLFIFKKQPKEILPQVFEGDVRQLSEIEFDKRPYVTLTPTSDGAEIIISVENMSAFDRLEYELTYLADNPQIAGQKIERGATGTDINTKDAKYKKSILLGTASRGVRNPDRGVTVGKLTMHMFKGSDEYQSETPWDLVQIGLRSESIRDRQGNFELAVPGLGRDYWVILADTIGVPPNSQFDLGKVILPTYGVFSIAKEFTKKGELKIKTNQENPTQIYSYNLADSKWQEVETTQNGSQVTGNVSNFATFVVVSAK